MSLELARVGPKPKLVELEIKALIRSRIGARIGSNIGALIALDSESKELGIKV